MNRRVKSHRLISGGTPSHSVHSGKRGRQRLVLLRSLHLCFCLVLLPLGSFPSMQLMKGFFDLHHDGFVIILQTLKKNKYNKNGILNVNIQSAEWEGQLSQVSVTSSHIPSECLGFHMFPLQPPGFCVAFSSFVQPLKTLQVGAPCSLKLAQGVNECVLGALPIQSVFLPHIQSSQEILQIKCLLNGNQTVYALISPTYTRCCALLFGSGTNPHPHEDSLPHPLEVRACPHRLAVINHRYNKHLVHSAVKVYPELHWWHHFLKKTIMLGLLQHQNKVIKV